MLNYALYGSKLLFVTLKIGFIQVRSVVSNKEVNEQSFFKSLAIVFFSVAAFDVKICAPDVVIYLQLFILLVQSNPTLGSTN